MIDVDHVVMVGMVLMIALGFAVPIGVGFARRRRDYREVLEPILAERGLSFISSRRPGMFNVGPFPKVELKFGRPQSHAIGVKGEYSAFRIVSCRESEGSAFELWAQIEFELFRLRRVRWRAEYPEKLPAEARKLLEA